MASPKNAARRRRGDAAKRERFAARRLGTFEQQAEIPGAEDPRPRWAAHDACFTPESVVEQGIEELLERGLVRPDAAVLDPCAGAGVFGKALRRIMPRAGLLVAVEPRDEEHEHLAHWYHECCRKTAQQFAADLLEDSRWRDDAFDFVTTNPPWWCWTDILDAVEPLLVPGGVVAFIGPSTWGHSDESSEGVEVFDRWSPILQLRIRGRIAFNGGSSTDNRKCSWWVWRKGESPREWATATLPALPAEQRRWSVRPGTEGACP